MGTWGYGLFCDDTAMDVRGDYRKLIRDHPELDDAEATRRMLARFGFDLSDAEDDAAVIWLALAVSQAEQADLAAQLRATLAARAVIDQALGIIMAEQRCSAAQAFDVLRRASQNRNIKVRDIAARIVTGVTGQPPQPPPFITTPRRPGPDGRDGPARPA